MTALFRQRRILGGLASLFFVLALVALADGIQHMARQDPLHLVLLPGETQPVSGWIPANATGAPTVEVQPPLELTLRGNQTGYYLGGAQWLGEVRVPPHAGLGNFTASVHFPGVPPQVVRVEVVASAAHKRAAAPSVLVRTLGLHPYAAAAGLAALGALITFAVFRLSSRIEAALQALGLAESSIDRQGHLTLPWGADQGLEAGAPVTLLDLGGQPVGQAQVVQVWEGHARAQTQGHPPGPVLVRLGSLAGDPNRP